MIVDCFPFFNELDLLEIRLNELDDIVDKVVIAESTITLSGKPKESFWLKNKHRFKKFEHKIVHVLTTPENCKTPQENDIWQKNSIMDGLKKLDLKDDDIICISDLDEIPSRDLANIKPNDVLAMKQIWCHGYVNNVYVNLNLQLYPWTWGRICTWQFAKDKTIWEIRFCNPKPEEIQCGWHFNYVRGGEQQVKTKIQSATHKEFDIQEVHDNIGKALKEGKDVLGRNDRIYVVMNHIPLPNYLLENKDKFSHLFLTEPNN